MLVFFRLKDTRDFVGHFLEVENNQGEGKEADEGEDDGEDEGHDDVVLETLPWVGEGGGGGQGGEDRIQGGLRLGGGAG